VNEVHAVRTLRIGLWLMMLGAALSAGAATETEHPAPADLVITDARIYTADPARSMAQAFAVRDGRIVFVGDARHAQAFIGTATRAKRLAGRLVLPGLVDSHIHPTDIVERDVCDLNSRTVQLRELAEFVRGCIERYHVPPGQWVSVRQWNYGNGNQPDPQHPTLRATLDAASTVHPIHLLGDDGHHGAFNSRALAGARNGAGQVVGLSRATLATDFADARVLAGVDAYGEPDGAVNEELQYAIDGPDDFASEVEDLAALLRAPERMTEQLNRAGITAVLDAFVPPSNLAVYDALEKSGRLTVRACLAQYYDPQRFRAADGSVDYRRMLALAESVRAKYAGNPRLRADVVKLFADGVIEGNPYASPPTLPNGAVLRPYLQPRFGRDATGRATVEGYVDTDSPACAAVRENPTAYTSAAAIDEFEHAHGHHPAQCTVSDGVLAYSREVILDFVRQFHRDGFALHIHVIGDRAARTAIDALEAARAEGGPDLGRDGLAHLELAHPDDVARIGRDRLYVAFTYSWAYIEPEYDLTAVPFIDRVAGNSATSLHPPDSYYYRNAYPVRGVRDAGGLLVGGSDAPVASYDPRPFVNMAKAVTRRLDDLPPLNPAQTIPIRDALDSYTISGARFLGWEAEAGSLEPGKSADFVILDRDILALADDGHPERIEGTRVLETWFMGRRVYAAPGRSAPRSRPAVPHAR